MQTRERGKNIKQIRKYLGDYSDEKSYQKSEKMEHRIIENKGKYDLFRTRNKLNLLEKSSIVIVIVYVFKVKV